MALASKYKLDAQGFSRVFDQGKAYRKAFFIVLAIPVSKQTGKIGVVVAKRNIKSAVARNRFKRVLYHWYQQHQSVFSNFDMVVLVRYQAASASKEHIQACLDQLRALLLPA